MTMINTEENQGSISKNQQLEIHENDANNSNNHQQSKELEQSKGLEFTGTNIRTTELKSLSGQLVVELGSLEIIEESVAPEKHGPDIQSSQHEEKDDYASATEELEENFDPEDDEVAYSCDKEEMLNTKEINDPVSKEIAQVIEQQGLSPRGNKKKKVKGKGGQPKLTDTNKKEGALQTSKIF
ncbi:hypothetical protein A4A49_33864 [Nicotiana attenuata]|uniref:Uncharacterized protein n=1 Tax=Nicotiana attenuata TaxID=49451 RepID=A0A1J6IRN1_NICAT|nr:hypothetical protein A4A49_33864 [Nicotiana attenuata]